MSSETNETIADILREMRDPNSGFCRWYADGGSCDCPKCAFDALADRIEAAAEREREMSKGLSKKLDKNHATPGNAAAIRLCDELIQAAYDADICSPGDLAHRVRKIQAALSVPARNCDVVLIENLAKRNIDDIVWTAFRETHPKAYLDVPGLLQCINWLFDKAEGGDHA